MLSAQEGLSALCVEVDVNDRGAFLFAEHDERDSLSRPYGEGYGLVEEVVVVRDFLLHVVRERVYRQFFTSDRPRDAQVALRKGHPHRNADTEVRSEEHICSHHLCRSHHLCGAAETLNCHFSGRLPPVSALLLISYSLLLTSAALRIQPP
jgi:hypothetical protein